MNPHAAKFPNDEYMDVLGLNFYTDNITITINSFVKLKNLYYLVYE